MHKERILNVEILCTDRESSHGSQRRTENSSNSSQLLVHLNKPIRTDEWRLLYGLVQHKKGLADGDDVEEYLKGFFQVYHLNLVTRFQFKRAIMYLLHLPDN